MIVTREVALRLARESGITNPSSSAINRFAQAAADLANKEIEQLRARAAELEAENRKLAEQKNAMWFKGEGAVQQYKDSVMKLAGEPVCRVSTTGIITNQTDRPLEPGLELFTSEQVATAVLKATKPLEEEVKAANSECELFRKNGRIVDANKIVELRTNLAAAQEANEHWQRATAENENKWIEANDKLAKAEQRVAEACALQVATETKFHWLDAARVAKEIRSGEWRKFVKEV